MLMTGNVAFLGLAPLPQGGFGSLVANIDVTWKTCQMQSFLELRFLYIKAKLVVPDFFLDFFVHFKGSKKRGHSS